LREGEQIFQVQEDSWGGGKLLDNGGKSHSMKIGFDTPRGGR